MATHRPTIAEMKESKVFELVAPLDYKLLEMLPDEGQLLAGLYPNGETVGNLYKRFSKEERAVLESSVISARIRVMATMGLVVKARKSANQIVWQRTPLGVSELNKWKGDSNGINGR